MIPTVPQTRLALEAEFKECIDTFLRTADKLEDAMASGNLAEYHSIREQLEVILSRCSVIRGKLENVAQTVTSVKE